MGSELLEESQPTESKSYRESFRETLPTYLALGMTVNEFFHDDPMLATYYRQADEIRLKRTNFEHWLLGQYIDEALAIEMSNMMLAKGKQPRRYRSEPYNFDVERDEEKIKKKEEVQAQAWMHNFVNMYKSRES